MIKSIRKEASNTFCRRWMTRVLAGLLILLSACAKSTPTERTFSMQELLVDASVFPEGWEISSGPRFAEWDQFSSTYGFWLIGFQADTDVPRHTAMLYVYQYHNVKIAQRMYEEITTSTLHRGEKLPDDTCDRLYAKQSQLNCESYQEHDQINCSWTGLYDEYIVHFGSWLVPERMSLEDVQDIICAIDTHVGPYFEPTLENGSEQ